MTETLKLTRAMHDDKHTTLDIAFPNGSLRYGFRNEEYDPAIRFVRRGLGGFLKQSANPIIIPPPADDEFMNERDHFHKGRTVFERAYFAMLSKHDISISPAQLFTHDTYESVPDFLSRLERFFGRALRIVPPDAIAKHWRGKLDEFNDIVWHDGKRYHRMPIIWSNNNDQVYASGIPVSAYLNLLEAYPPHPSMAYEDYFQKLRRDAAEGKIQPSPWKIEELYPNQPHLF